MRPKKVAIKSKDDGVYGLKISSTNDQEIVNWSGDSSQEWTEQEITNGENVVGIYGLN